MNSNIVKRIFITFILSVSFTAAACAAPATKQSSSETDGIQKLVIGISTTDPHYQNLALTNAINVIEAVPGQVQIEIVVWGPAIPMVLEDSKLKERIQNFLLMGEIKFTACGNTLDTLERNTGKTPILIEGVNVYKVGVLRVMQLQNKGYAFLHY